MISLPKAGFGNSLHVSPTTNPKRSVSFLKEQYPALQPGGSIIHFMVCRIPQLLKEYYLAVSAFAVSFLFSAGTQCQHIAIKVGPVLLLGVDGFAVTVSVRNSLVKTRFHISYNKGQRQTGVTANKEKNICGDNGDQGKL